MTNIDDLPAFFLSHGFREIKDQYEDLESGNKKVFRYGTRYKFWIDLPNMKYFNYRKFICEWHGQISDDELAGIIAYLNLGSRDRAMIGITGVHTLENDKLSEIASYPEEKHVIRAHEKRIIQKFKKVQIELSKSWFNRTLQGIKTEHNKDK